LFVKHFHKENQQTPGRGFVCKHKNAFKNKHPTTILKQSNGLGTPIQKYRLYS
jgi:hypothetical protein